MVSTSTRQLGPTVEVPERAILSSLIHTLHQYKRDGGSIVICSGSICFTGTNHKVPVTQLLSR